MERRHHKVMTNDKENAVMKTSVELLAQYLKIDTTNPPGGEAPAAAFFSSILEKEGIPCKTYEPAPGRVSLRAEIPGTGEKGPVILLNHMDVVPAQKNDWSFDPFGGEIRDGFICGRGALDMKCLGIMQLMAFLELHRSGEKPNRDVIFMAVADEETGGSMGAGWLLEHHREDFEAAVVLNEGGFGVTGLVAESPVCMVSTAEKGICWMRLTRSGPPGHGSVPHGDNALERLCGAVSRVIENSQQLTVTPIIEDYFHALATGWDFLQPWVEDGKPETLLDILQQTGLSAMPQMAAMLKNTISLTVMQAGEKSNVIPAFAEAHLDARILPGQDIEDFVRGLRETLQDDAIQVEVMHSCEASESSRDTDEYRTIREVLLAHDPKAIVAPSLLFATSDSRFFRLHGIPAYGVCPVFVTLDDIKMVHGIDEKISVENMTHGTVIFTDLLQRLCRSNG
jgi:acetylornithine deacetylase/succinyl-diaminopimelate desuccinylase-like protein